MMGQPARCLACACTPKILHAPRMPAHPAPHLRPSIPHPLQEKRSSYAPTQDTPVRYDGIYRIARCWRTKGNQVGGRGRDGGPRSRSTAAAAGGSLCDSVLKRVAG